MEAFVFTAADALTVSVSVANVGLPNSHLTAERQNFLEGGVG
jgi:hypothetical protein